eukprot:PhF_6_TR30182/c0_g1_i1/m.44326/K10297/FBXO11; F-box protein 11
MYHIDAELDGNAVCRIKSSSWRPNAAVKTYYVSSKPRKGYFSNISDAAAFVDPYSRIELLPGRYFENVVLTKPVEIGTSKGDEGVEVFSHGVTLTLDVDEAFIEGLHIYTEEDSASAVVIESGSPTLTRCTLESISVINKATPVIEDNVISGSSIHGVHVEHAAGGSYRQNTIENHSWFCICVESSGQPEFFHNKITKGEMGQIKIIGKGSSSHHGTHHHSRRGSEEKENAVEPLFKFNRIIDESKQTKHRHTFGPKSTTRFVKQSGDTTELLHTQYRKVTRMNATEKSENNITTATKNSKTQEPSRSTKLSIDDGRVSPGSDNVEHNNNNNTASIVFRPPTNTNTTRLTQNSRAAITVIQGANPSFIRNTIQTCVDTAIRFTDASKGVVESCTLCNNMGWGIIVDHGSSPKILRCSIYQNGAGGVLVKTTRNVAIVNNDVYDNFGPGICVQGSSEGLLILKNIIRGGHTIGVLFQNEGTGTLKENDIKEALCGVRVETMANPVVEQNFVHICNVGISALSKAQGVFTFNEITSNSEVNVEVKLAATPIFEENRISQSQVGVLVHTASGRYVKNLFRDQRKTHVLVCGRTSALSSASFVDNKFEGSKETSVLIQDFANPVFESNYFVHGQGPHVRVEGNADPTFVENTLENALYGFFLTENSTGSYNENLIRFNRLSGVILQGMTYPTIRGNDITRNVGYGLHVMEESSCVVEKNVIELNDNGNIFIAGMNRKVSHVTIEITKKLDLQQPEIRHPCDRQRYTSHFKKRV